MFFIVLLNSDVINSIPSSFPSGVLSDANVQDALVCAKHFLLYRPTKLFRQLGPFAQKELSSPLVAQAMLAHLIAVGHNNH